MFSIFRKLIFFFFFAIKIAHFLNILQTLKLNSTNIC